MVAIPHIVENILSTLPVLVCHGFCPNIFLVSRCVGHFNILARKFSFSQILLLCIMERCIVIGPFYLQIVGWNVLYFYLMWFRKLGLGSSWTRTICEAMHSGVRKHGWVGDSHTNFLPKQSVSCGKGDGGGVVGGRFKISRFVGYEI